MQKVISAGIPKKTVTGTSSNTAQSLSDLGATVSISDYESGKPKFAFISVETNAVRLCLGGDATTSLGRLYQPGDGFKLEQDEILGATIISAVAGSHGTLQITTEF